MSIRIPKRLLGADDDWIEVVRKTAHDTLDPYLKRLETSREVCLEQYVGRIQIDEESFEEVLEQLGFIRNPLAYYKYTPEDRPSTGSWVLLSGDGPIKIRSGRQLHITIYESEDGIDVFAHNEFDWREHPVRHLREEIILYELGVEQAQLIINDYTTLSTEK